MTKNFDDARRAACSEILIKQTQNFNTSEASQFWNTFNKMFSSKSNKQIGPLLDDKGEYMLNARWKQMAEKSVNDNECPHALSSSLIRLFDLLSLN